MISPAMRGRLHRYRRAVSWLAADGIRSNWRRVIGIFAFQLIGVLTATSSMGLVLGYIHWAQDPYPLVLAGWTILEAPGRSALLLASLAALVMGVLSASCLYLGDYSVAQLTRVYQHTLLRRLLAVASHPRIGEITLQFERQFYQPITLRDLLIAGSRFAAFSMRALVQLFLPALTLIVASAALFALDPITTLLLSTLIALYLFPLYHINHRVAGHHRTYRQLNRGVSKSLISALSGVLGTSGPARELSHRAGEHLLADDDFQSMQSALYGRMLATKRVALLNGVFLILLVVIILWLFSGEESISWTRVLAYIVALRFAWTSVRQVTALFTNFNQFFVEVEKVAGFLRLAEDANEQVTPASETASLLELASSAKPRRMFHAPDRVALEPGSVVLAINPRPIDRIALEHTTLALAKPVAGAGKTLQLAVYHDQPRLTDGFTLLAHVFGDKSPNEHDRVWLNALLAAAGQTDVVDGLPQGVETLASPETHRVLSRHARYLVGIAYLLRYPPAIAVLSLAPLAEAPVKLREEVLSRLKNSIVILVDSDDTTWSDEDAADLREATTHVAVILERDDVAIGDRAWFDRQRHELLAAIAPLLAERLPAGGGDASDDLTEIE